MKQQRTFRYLNLILIALLLIGYQTFIQPCYQQVFAHSQESVPANCNHLLAANNAGSSLPSLAVVARVPMGTAPHGLALHPGEPELYVTDFSAGSVSVINTDSLTITNEIDVGAGPVNIVISQDGSTAYVTNELAGTLSAIDTNSKTVLDTIAVGERPHGLVLATNPADNQIDALLYVANLDDDEVAIVDTGSFTVTGTIAVGSTPDSPIVNASGTRLWVTNYDGGGISTISVVDTQTGLEIDTITLGVHPHAIQLSSDEATIYATIQGEDRVVAIDTSTNTVNDSFPVGNIPHGLGLSPDGRYLWTGEWGTNGSSVIDLATGRSIARLIIGPLAQPHIIVFSADGKFAYVSDFLGRQVVVVDTTIHETFLPTIFNP